MNTDLKPYPSTKQSEVRWLGEVPSHWEVRHLGRLGKLVKGNGGTKEDETPSGVPCVRYGDLYTTHSSFIQRSRSFVSRATAQHYTPISYGDVLFAASGETIDEIGKSAVNLMHSDAVCGGDVILFRPRVQMDARFLGYALDCRSAAAQKSVMGRGITVMHIYGDQLKHLGIALPPPEEQAAIVRYLDHVDRRISRYIRAKQRLIALLEEEKQAIIHRAVTRGLDPEVRLKPSGVEWLGDIPEHWEVTPLKRISTLDNSGSYGSEPEQGEQVVPVATTAQIDRDGRFAVDRMPQRGFSLNDVQRYGCHPGDILVVKSSGSIFNVISGKAGIVRADTPHFVFSNFLMRIVPDPIAVDPEYLFLLLSGYLTRERVKRMVSGTTYPNLRVGEYVAAPFPLPPIREQQAIVATFSLRTADIDQGLRSAQRGIELLREYRTRLISDVVTGKLDVREAAANLPEVDPADLEDILEVGDATEKELEPELEEIAT